MRCYTMVLLLVGLTPMSLLSANRAAANFGIAPSLMRASSFVGTMNQSADESTYPKRSEPRAQLSFIGPKGLQFTTSGNGANGIRAREADRRPQVLVASPHMISWAACGTVDNGSAFSISSSNARAEVSGEGISISDDDPSDACN
jgi:hypothetical protein